MSQKYSDSFHTSLIAQYKEMLHEAALESDHKLYLDTKLFERKIALIRNAALLDGVSETEITALVEEALAEAPTHQKAG